MNPELQQIIKDYKLEDATIRIGRIKAYPAREGIEPSESQIANLRSALEGNSVKGFVEVTQLDQTILLNKSGELEVPYTPAVVPQQAELFTDSILIGEGELASVETHNEDDVREAEAVEEFEEEVIEEQEILDESLHYLDDPFFREEENQEIVDEALNEPSFHEDDTLEYRQMETMAMMRGEVDNFLGQAIDPSEIEAWVNSEKAFHDAEVAWASISSGGTIEEAEALSEKADILFKEALSVSKSVKLEDGPNIDLAEKKQNLDELYLEQWEVPEAENLYAEPSAENFQDEDRPQIQDEVDAIQPIAETDLITESIPEEISVNEAYKDQYLDLLSLHPEMEGQTIDYNALLELPPDMQQQMDAKVTEMAQEIGIPTDEYTRTIAQGSAYVASNLENKVGNQGPQISEGLQYLTDKTSLYEKNLAKDVLPEVVTEPVVATVMGTDPVTEMPVPIDTEVVAQKTTVDAGRFPEQAATLDPAYNLKQSISQGAKQVSTTAKASAETLSLAAKNMETFAKTIKHKGFKAWATEKIPVLKEKAAELVANAGQHIKEQAPVVKDAVIAGATKAGQEISQFAKEQAPVVKEAAIKAGQAVSQYAKEQGPVVADALFNAVEKIAQRVDPQQIEQFGQKILDKDNTFEGRDFNFSRTKDGSVNIQLKDGTSVFANGKLNQSLDGSHVWKLNAAADKVAPKVQEAKRKVAVA